ncbi:MAG: 7-carboxy-7-deazaguanine synthase QueE [Alphaproteobacteria bacterium]|nr:7-carboxy-7-deazaguanine synthase QueE [Alphaproteobacteria bacterium]
MTQTIAVSEIFGPTVQGEGPLIGRPTVFVRTGGCDYRCRWCDTLYAVLPEHRDEWTSLTAEEIAARIGELTAGKPVLVTVSGGNPALQPLAPLIALGRRAGYRFALETQGSVARDWFAALDWLIVSPKPPSSGMVTDWEAFEACLAAAGDAPRRALKIVIFDEGDYAYARATAARFPSLPVYLQTGNPAPELGRDDPLGVEADFDALRRQTRWLIERVASDRWFDVTVLPQLHVLVWGNRRGV